MNNRSSYRASRLVISRRSPRRERADASNNNKAVSYCALVRAGTHAHAGTAVTLRSTQSHCPQRD